MRTTIHLAPSLLETAKTAANGRGVTLEEFVQDVLLAYLASCGKSAPPRFTLHTVCGQLMQPVLDLDRSSGLMLADDESAYIGTLTR